MVWTSKAILSLVELIIYISLTPVIMYTFYRHRVRSLLGHIYLYAFIALRLVADGLTISHRNDIPGSDTTGAILNSIGLSPLLLATAGFVHESRSYVLDSAPNIFEKRLGWITDFGLHLLVVTGVALLATGGSKAATATVSTDFDNYRTLAYTGAVLLLTAWLSVCVWSIWNFQLSSKLKNRGAHYQSARTLLTEILVSLPFTGIRTCYSVVYTFDHSRDLNPATSTFVVAFFLIFLVQLIAALILILGLVVTRDIKTLSDAKAISAQPNGGMITRVNKMHVEP